MAMLSGLLERDAAQRIGANNLGPDDEDNAEAAWFFHEVDWHVLARIASRHREGRQRSYPDVADKLDSIGQFYLVRRLNFTDGVSWNVKVWLPFRARHARLKPEGGFGWSPKRLVESEVATMKYLMENSSIPVPEVFVYDPSINDAGVAYMMCSYIDGNLASELRQRLDSAPNTYGTAAQDRKFHEQVARIQAKMLSFKFGEIGSLYYEEEDKELHFWVGPDAETGRGPWTVSSEYYAAYTGWLLRKMAKHKPEKLQESPAFTLLLLLSYMASLGGRLPEPAWPFRLVHQDFGAHNILVDDDFNVVGIIDLHGVFSGPMEAAAQYPILMGTPEPDAADVEGASMAIQARLLRKRPEIPHYKRYLRNCYRVEADDIFAVAEALGSDGALGYLGMIRCLDLAPLEIKDLFEGALQWLREHAGRSVWLGPY